MNGRHGAVSDATAARASTVAVTGASGFVGRHLVRHLVERGHTVRAMRRKADGPATIGSLRWLEADLTRDDTGPLRDFLDGVDVLFHCAGEVRDERLMHAVHVDGTSRLVAAAAGRVRRWVHLSSCGVYGRVRSGVVHEDHALRPEGVYETSKLAAEQIVLSAGADGAFSAVAIRPSVIVAEDMGNASLRSWIARVAAGQFFFVGEPGARVNYVHVEDVAAAMAHAAHADGATGVYNLSLGATIEEAVQIMCAELGRPMVRRRVPVRLALAVAAVGAVVPRFPLTRSRVEALGNRAHYASERVVEELGFDFSVSLEEALRRLVRSVSAAVGAAA